MTVTVWKRMCVLVRTSLLRNGMEMTNFETFYGLEKKGKRKVQGMPQSQTAALPRHQEEEETDKSKQAQTEQKYEKH